MHSMSKASRHTSKQGQTANKQSNNRSSKQNGLANKQTGSVSEKQTGPVTKQTSNQSPDQTGSANKQTDNVVGKQTSPASKQTTAAPVKQSSPVSKPFTRQAIKQDRREERQRRFEQQRATRKKRNIIIGVIAALVVLAAGIISYAIINNSHNATAQNPSALPTEQVFNQAYPPVDGIYCDQLEQTNFHIHVHLSIWIKGQQITVPQGTGIASDGSCFYWLHTHDTTGVVHIEAPQIATLNLGNFLDIWGKEFPQSYHDELASSTGWKIYVDGKPVTGDFNKVIFRSHMLITIMYKSPKAPIDTIYSWPADLPQ